MTWGPGISSFVSANFVVIIGPRNKTYIPDVNFRNHIFNAFPGFMVGDSLIIDSAATVTTSLSCGSKNISDLTGLEWFFNVQWLYINDNQLTSLPSGLSSFTNLKWLRCQDNQLDSIPDLSTVNGLRQIYCYNNNLTSMPTLKTPGSTIQKIFCENNQLTSLPDLKFQFGLDRLYCNNNALTNLPDLSNTAMIELRFLLQSHW